ncbi:MAG: prepilin-type N-terminal cleavage/methylation domain-containing protein [Planctomycetaceae bacterium]|nr:prepilin-type N-terminal cleavage/methylation domain-containing protein [Planctomycetaceae bacterium]
MRRTTRVNAFTLVELLVVIAIIAVLVAILVPVIGNALVSARSVACSTTLKSLGAAWRRHAMDHNDLAVAGRDYTDPVYYKFWSGAQERPPASASDLTKYHPDMSPLMPYMGDGRMDACPAWSGLPNNGQMGIGYNWYYFSYYDGTPAGGGPKTFNWTNIHSIQRPASKVCFADCARNVKSNPNLLETTPFLNPPSQDYPGFHARHGGKGNVLWVDGHVGEERAKWIRAAYTATGQAAITLEQAKSNNVGDLDMDENPATDELFTVD